MSASPRRGEHSPLHRAYLPPCYGVGGPHKTTTLITVSVLPQLLDQQVDLSWTSEKRERAGNVGDVKVTDEDGFLLCSMMIKAMNTIMKEEFLTNRVAGQLFFSRASRPASESRIPPAYCHCWNAVTLPFLLMWLQLRRKLKTRCSLLLGLVSIQMPSRTLTLKPGENAPKCS